LVAARAVGGVGGQACAAFVAEESLRRESGRNLHVQPNIEDRFGDAADPARRRHSDRSADLSVPDRGGEIFHVGLVRSHRRVSAFLALYGFRSPGNGGRFPV